MITISIDLKLIDQSKCKKIVRKNGTPATFLDLVLIDTPSGEYGDYMVKQDTTREERESGLQMPILGNGKIRGQKPQGEPGSRPPATNRPPADPDLDTPEDDCPF